MTNLNPPPQDSGTNSLKSILLVDNEPITVATHVDYLRKRNYRVRVVTSIDEALKAFAEEWFHLAIIDVRLKDDTDERDHSGLDFAKSLSPTIAKIILTVNRDFETVRDSLSPTTDGSTPAIHLASKVEKLNLLLTFVESVFSQHVRINWHLKIGWERLDASYLARLIEPGLSQEAQMSRTTELEDLFRRLFFTEKEISVRQLLWQREGRLALSVHSSGDSIPTAHVVVCGRHPTVLAETERFRIHSPRGQGETATVLHTTAETTNFAANAYALAGADPEQTLSLKELFRTNQEKFPATLKALHEKTLTAWSQGQEEFANDRTLDECFRERLSLTTEPAARADFQRKIQALIEQCSKVGLQVDQSDGIVRCAIRGQVFEGLAPTVSMYRRFNLRQRLIVINTPGDLAGDSILVDARKGAWVTDFARAGLALKFWNHVELEAALRFDWIATADLDEIVELERCLSSRNFTQFQLSDVSISLRKYLKAIQQVRMFAMEDIPSPAAYHLALLFHALERLSHFNLPFNTMKAELVRPAHWLVAAVLLSNWLPRQKAQIPTSEKKVGGVIHYDRQRDEVRSNGIRIELSGRGYDIFRYLYDHANRVCTREEIFQSVYDRTYDPKGGDVNTLNEEIHRLRKKIEENFSEPKFLQSKRGRGYRLVLDPANEDGG